MDFEGIFAKALSHKAFLDNVDKDIKDNTIKINKGLDDLVLLNKMYEDHEKAFEYLSEMIKNESGKFMRKLTEIINYSVKTIFFDEDYVVDIRVNKDNSTAAFMLTKTEDDGNKITSNIKDCGGGLRTVVGIINQLFHIFHYKAEPVLFIDEGISQVSSIYIPYLMALLQELCEGNGLKIMLITHDTRLMAYADKAYEIIDGRSELRKRGDAKEAENGK